MRGGGCRSQKSENQSSVSLTEVRSEEPASCILQRLNRVKAEGGSVEEQSELTH